jgi:hypothetical protein
METNKQPKLLTVLTGYHHHYKNNFTFFNRIINVIGWIFQFLWEFLFYFVYLAFRILLACICIAAWIVFFLYLELKKLIKIIKNIGTFIIFVSTNRRDIP